MTTIDNGEPGTLVKRVVLFGAIASTCLLGLRGHNFLIGYINIHAVNIEERLKAARDDLGKFNTNSDESFYNFFTGARINYNLGVINELEKEVEEESPFELTKVTYTKPIRDDNQN